MSAGKEKPAVGYFVPVRRGLLDPTDIYNDYTLITLTKSTSISAQDS
jgi:hypothetical protein